MPVIDSIESLRAFAESFIDSHPKGLIVGLKGNLGAGKTEFVRQVIQVLALRKGIQIARVLSPSFVLHQSYRELSPSVDHFDFYRLENATDHALTEIGYFEAFQHAKQTSGFVFVEWPEKARADLRLQCEVEIAIEANSTQRRVAVAFLGST